MTKQECIALLVRYANYDGMGIPKLAGCKEAMLKAVELLSQPSLPSDVDEAAESLYPNMSRKFVSAFGTLEVDRYKPERDAFKAGAKWMANKGVTKEAKIGLETEEVIVTVSPETLFNLGVGTDDIIEIQIRKK